MKPVIKNKTPPAIPKSPAENKIMAPKIIIDQLIRECFLLMKKTKIKATIDSNTLSKSLIVK